MSMYYVGKELEFPNPLHASEDGLLAVGGDLSPERLLFAYENAIFPWYSDDEPILWWSPNPRFILLADEIRVSRSMKKFMKKESYHVSYDKVFADVIEACATVKRGDGNGTWITEEMKEAYINLHKLGYAHSVECWCGEDLVGGLYGVSIGKAFFGESMFSKQDNASKTAFINLVEKLKEHDFEIIDCQVYTKHLESLGAKQIEREEFLDKLKLVVGKESLVGDWDKIL